MATSLFFTSLLLSSQLINVAIAAPQHGVGLVRRTFNDLGCWSDVTTDSTFTFSAGSAMSQTLCQETCAANGFIGEFMDDSNVCHCWNSFTSGTQVAATQCNNPCPGNTAQNCGGPGVFSVFGPSAPAAPAPVATSTTTTTTTATTTETDTTTTTSTETTTTTGGTTTTTTSTDIETTTTTSTALTTSTSVVPSTKTTTVTSTSIVPSTKITKVTSTSVVPSTKITRVTSTSVVPSTKTKTVTSIATKTIYVYEVYPDHGRNDQQGPSKGNGTPQGKNPGGHY